MFGPSLRLSGAGLAACALVLASGPGSTAQTRPGAPDRAAATASSASVGSPARGLLGVASTW